MSGAVLIRRSGEADGVATVQLDRAHKANAYTQPMLARLREILCELAADSTVKTLILTGSGKHFCAGADRDELDARAGEDALDLASRETFDLLARMPQPVIAAIDGGAIGGGFELALACDLRICSPSARFAFPETKLGLVPAAGGMRRLVEMIGTARTKELVLFGRELDATTAHAWGIVSAIERDVATAATVIATAALSRDALAQRLAKSAIDAKAMGSEVALEAAIQAFLYERRAKR
jgi:enoyl-CoA hydratase/carnithine racemase